VYNKNFYIIYIFEYNIKMELSTYSSVSNATLNRFFSLHFLLPFLLTALAMAHLIAHKGLKI